MARSNYTAQNIKWNIIDYKEEDEENIEVLERMLKQKRERFKEVWELMDHYTMLYDKLMQEIDLLCYKIKKWKNL
jgi:hypothetical protein